MITADAPVALGGPARTLAEAHVGLARREAEFWAEALPELRDELESEAMLVLCEAAYFASLVAVRDFPAWAGQRIRWRLINLVEAEGRRRARSRDLDPDQLPMADPGLAELEDREHVAALLARLHPRYAAALRLFYLEGAGCIAGAHALGVPVPAFCGLVRRGLARLRAMAT